MQCKHQVVVQAFESNGLAAAQRITVSDNMLSEELVKCIGSL